MSQMTKLFNLALGFKLARISSKAKAVQVRQIRNIIRKYNMEV